MNIVLTGSLGHIGEPLARSLVGQGNSVTVISSKQEKQSAIEGLGASAAIGSLEDAAFLAATFNGADAVYCMVPHNYAEPDQNEYYRRLGEHYVTAIRQSGVTRAVLLSSFGANLDKGTGVILGSHHMEEMFKLVPGLNLTLLRPTYFYYNLLNFIDTIRYQGAMISNYGGDDVIAMVSPLDIAAALAEELTLPVDGLKVRYVGSDERTGHEIAKVLGESIGIPDLKWNTIDDPEMQQILESHGMPASVASDLVALNASLHSGKLAEDYFIHQPQLGRVKLEDYVQEFAAAYRAKYPA